MKSSVIVLMSTYNGEKYISEQIDSILNQKNVSIKLIIRDDGSSDSTKNILDKYYKENKNIYVKYGNNIGPCKSFLTLLYEEVEGDYDYIAFSDQDDIWEENKLEKGIKKIENKEGASLYYSTLKTWNMDTDTICIHSNKFCSNFSEALIKSLFPGCTMIMNRKGVNLIHQYGKPDHAIMHDWYIYQIFSGLNCNIEYDNQSYIKYRIHGNNVSVVQNNIIKKIKHCLKILMKEKGKRLEAVKEIQHLIQKDMGDDENKYILNTILNYDKGIRGLRYAIDVVLKTRFNLKTKISFILLFIFKIF